MWRTAGTPTPSRRAVAALGVLLLLTLVSDALGAQSIARQVSAVVNGQVRFSFAAREGVCGDGDRISTRRRTEDWEGRCEDGPVRVALGVEQGTVTDVDTYVGGRWLQRAGTVVDLGMVATTEAADYLLTVAERTDSRVGEKAVFPATLADSVEVWPRLLRIAKDEGRSRAVRKSAVFWLGTVAADVAVRDLEQLARDDDTDHEVRVAALFGLSQLDEHQGVPALLDIARTSRDRDLRKQAIFWLGQTGDPRALAFFEEILTARR
jgi:hypothetical protein